MCWPSAQSLESEQEKDDQQLKQGSDKAAVLQDELIQAADRERQLQMQLDKMKDDLTQLQTRLEHQSKDFDDFKLRSVRLWEQEMEKRESRLTAYSLVLEESDSVNIERWCFCEAGIDLHW